MFRVHPTGSSNTVPHEAGNQEQKSNSLKDIIRLKPTDNLLDVGPYPPAHAKRDNKTQQLEAVGLLGSVVTIDGNDAD